MEKNEFDWLAKRFGIPESDILWYNSGICYSRIMVRTRESAEKVSKAVAGETVNGGMFDGMPLGRINFGHKTDGTIYYDITC